MQRTGLRFYRVESDVGMMGGLGAHEYMAPCPAGEDEVVLGEGYAANIEVARRSPDVRHVVGGSASPVEGGSARAVGEGPMEGGSASEDSVEGEWLRDGEPLTVEPAIEVGNIFKLGTRYSEPLGATYLDERGNELPIWMGSYGIGPARVVAAAVEQFADEHGISWPRALAPFDLHLVALGRPGTPERDAAEQLYRTLSEAGVSLVYDDREAAPGEKFADAELLGCPLRLTVGRRALESGEAEVQIRRGRAQAPGLALDAEPQALARALDELCGGLP
jgi:prolyl-tRNA synthetase